MLLERFFFFNSLYFPVNCFQFIHNYSIDRRCQKSYNLVARKLHPFFMCCEASPVHLLLPPP